MMPRRGFKARMIRKLAYLIGLTLLFLPLSCSKEMDISLNPSNDYTYQGPTNGKGTWQAIATLRSRDGIRYLVLDETSVGFIVNPDSVQEIPDGTRIYTQYQPVSATLPDFCTEAVRLEWAASVDVGDISFYTDAPEGAPVDIVTDWMTSLEDGFLTLHYKIRTSGKVAHSFELRPDSEGHFRLLHDARIPMCVMQQAEVSFRLLHDAHGDTGEEVTEGLVCFPVAGLLPDTQGETVTLSLHYINLNKQASTLTVDYRSPK